jgi:uncharacterized tellurite resistance protein B-like protein
MIQKLKKIFAGAPAKTAERADPVQIAAAGLLMEAARMDGQVDAGEEETVARLLERRFGLEADAAAELARRAKGDAEESVELYRMTRDLKNALDHDERVELMQMLWQVAYADGELHEYEANLMRRVAGLIYISDRESAEARKRALRSMGVLE